MTLRNSNKRTGWRIGSAVLLAVASQANPALATAAQFLTYSPPHAPLLLVRTLYRPLPDGKAIITRRSYSVRIVPDGTGYRVDGELVLATVDAPPSLAALAEIERRRPDLGMFPILLDGQGQIRGGGNVLSDGSLGRAAVIAAEAIGGSGLPAIDMLQAQAFVKHLSSRSPRSQWPADVFNPAPGKRDEARTIALPGGSEGSVTIEIATQGANRTGQLALLERVVTTDLAGDTRVTREQWQLSKVSGDASR
ncbi:MAG: hypothetical protein ABIM50_04195 [Novosphingobium sp.]